MKNLAKYIKASLIIIVFAVIIVNQLQISHALAMIGSKDVFSSMATNLFQPEANKGKLSVGQGDLSKVDINAIKSTAQGVAAVFAINQNMTPEQASAMVMPSGIPEYGQAMGVSFDDPVKSLATLSNAQSTLLAGLTPEQKQRFVALGMKPIGISCEFCCSVGTVGITPEGTSKCGCGHIAAILSVAMWLIQNTNYSDAEVLREVYRWKALFFPKKRQQENYLPEMVGHLSLVPFTY